MPKQAVCRSSSCCWHASSVTPEQGSVRWCLCISVPCNEMSAPWKMLRRRWKARWTDPERRPNRKDARYVSRYPVMKCRHPERDSGTALLKNLCLSLYLYLLSLCRMALKTISQSLKYCMLRLGDLVTRLSNTKNGRQELRLQSVVNKKTYSGTRLRSDPSYVVVNLVFFILMSDGSKNRVSTFVSIVCYVFVILWLDCQTPRW